MKKREDVLYQANLIFRNSFDPGCTIFITPGWSRTVKKECYFFVYVGYNIKKKLGKSFRDFLIDYMLSERSEYLPESYVIAEAGLTLEELLFRIIPKLTFYPVLNYSISCI